MKTILEAKERIAQLWGHPKPKDTNYRLMKYLLQCEVEDGVLLHNCVTGHLVLLTSEEAKLLQSLPSGPTETMQELIADHFLVPEAYDEYKTVNQLRAIYQKRDTGDAINHYIILPTTFCNAHCFYCYESDYPHIHMTEETADKIIDYIDEHRKGKDVLLSWFGGEPLVGMARIDQISQGLKDRQIKFSSNMISNGYLFDEQVVEKAKSLWKLNRVQITLDGTEEVYNKVKAYVSVKGSPFQRVLRNIDLLSENEIHVNIRLNVDFYNKDNISTLMNILVSRYSGNDKVRVYLNMLYNNQGFEPVCHSQDDMVKLLDIIDRYSEFLKENKLAQSRVKIPYLQTEQCMADNPHAVMLQPDGGFCRCEHEDIRDSYGSVDEGVLNPRKAQEWRKTVMRSAYCPECLFYPSCYSLRGCMSAETPCIEKFRLRYQESYNELLKYVYNKNVEDNKNEDI